MMYEIVKMVGLIDILSEFVIEESISGFKDFVEFFDLVKNLKLWFRYL